MVDREMHVADTLLYQISPVTGGRGGREAGLVLLVGGPQDAPFGFYLREAFQSQTNYEWQLFCGTLTQCYCRHEDAGPCSPWHARCMKYQPTHSHALLVTPVGQCHHGAHVARSLRCHQRCHQLPLSKHWMQPPTHSCRSGTTVAARRQCRQNTSMTVDTCQARRGDLAEGCALVACHICHTKTCQGSADYINTYC